MRNNIIYFIFAIAVLMALILLTICLSETVPDAGGKPHAEIAGLQIGGDGAARLEHIGFLGFMFQSLLMVQIVSLSILGVAERYRTKKFLIYMASALALMLLIGWQMFSGHLEYLSSNETGYFLGFPNATAWATYGIWLSAIPLVLIYSLGFREFIYTEEDERKFNELLAEKASLQE